MSKLILPTKHQFQITHAYLYYLLESSILEKEGLHFTQLFNCSSEETNQFSSFQSLSCVWLFATPWTAACQASLSITNSWSLLKLMSTESVMPSNHLIFVVPFSSCLQSFPASGSFQVSHFFASGIKLLGFQLQHQSFKWLFRTDFF